VPHPKKIKPKTDIIHSGCVAPRESWWRPVFIANHPKPQKGSAKKQARKTASLGDWFTMGIMS
jgi:hypothetical protein